MHGGSDRLPPPHLKDFHDFDLTGIRIGVWESHFKDSELTVQEPVRAAIEVLKSLGAKVHAVRIPHMKELSISHGTYITAEFAAFHDVEHHDPKGKLLPGTLIDLGLGYELSAVEMIASARLRGFAMKKMKVILG